MTETQAWKLYGHAVRTVGVVLTFAAVGCVVGALSSGLVGDDTRTLSALVLGLVAAVIGCAVRATSVEDAMRKLDR